VISLGVDFAAQPENTAACLIHWQSGFAEIGNMACSVNDHAFLELVRCSDKAGVDIPLGWPTDFVHAIAKHHEFLPWPNGERRNLCYRDTDLFIANETGRLPLSVSSDRIGVPTMRIAALMSRMDGAVDRSGSGKLVEVYPAAALRRWGFDPGGYRGKKGEEKWHALTVALLSRTNKWLRVSGVQQETCFRSDHSLDALVSALVARASAIGQTEPVPVSSRNRARTEGWIALPFSQSIDRLTQS
jgi:hypothetical protein